MNLFRFITGLMTAYMALIAAVGCFAMVESICRRSMQEAALGLIWFVGFLFATLIMGAICWVEGDGM
jgi:hypothetical protein